ncbi:MAG: hypothetical protein WCO56_26535 [Verrucomicrobiota bacterium]
MFTRLIKLRPATGVLLVLLGSLMAAMADPASLRLAIQDLAATFGGKYPLGRQYLERLAACRT